MTNLSSLRPVTFRVVCAIARDVIQRRPNFTDSDWKEAVKLLAARQGWETPTPDMVAKAFAAVECALEKVGTPRMGPLEAHPRRALTPPREDVRPLSKAEAAAAFRAIEERFHRSRKAS